MITEDYVSFEVAKLLKDKGFNEPCIATYNSVTKNFEVEEIYQDWTTHWKAYISAPTLQMAMKWLREVHDIEITIDYDNDVDCLEYERWGFTWYANPHYEVDLNTFATYEEACEAAIKYCLENLIKWKY